MALQFNCFSSLPPLSFIYLFAAFGVPQKLQKNLIYMSEFGPGPDIVALLTG